MPNPVSLSADRARGSKKSKKLKSAGRSILHVTRRPTPRQHPGPLAQKGKGGSSRISAGSATDPLRPVSGPQAATAMTAAWPGQWVSCFSSLSGAISWPSPQGNLCPGLAGRASPSSVHSAQRKTPRSEAGACSPYRLTARWTWSRRAGVFSRCVHNPNGWLFWPTHRREPPRACSCPCSGRKRTRSAPGQISAMRCTS